MAWNESKDVQEHRIDAPLDIGLDIARIAQYNSLGTRVYPVYKAEKSQILVAGPLKSGQVFQDTPPQTVQKTDTPFPNGYPDEVAGTKGNAIVVPTPQDLSTPRLSDPLPQPQMVRIPAGTFLMGSPATEKGRYDNEGPQHEVIVPAFEIGETEVTFAEWDRCAEAGVCRQVDDEGWGKRTTPRYQRELEGYPNVYSVVEYRAWSFRGPRPIVCQLKPNGNMRRAVVIGKRYGREHQMKVRLATLRFYRENSNTQTAEVKSKRPNAFGLYDMSGNVWEWVQDCYAESYKGAPVDGSAREAKSGRDL